MARSSSSIGHIYRFIFALVSWAILIAAPFMAPASFVRNHNSVYIMIGAMLLTVSFSIFAIVMWLADKGRAK